MYEGQKYELSDGKGNVILKEDTRILEQEMNSKLDELDKEFTEKYHEKLGLPNKEKGDRKIQEARLGISKDKKKEKELLKKDEEIKTEYRLRKEMILNAKDCDECHDAVHKPKKLVKKTILGITTGHKLEDI